MRLATSVGQDKFALVLMVGLVGSRENVNSLPAAVHIEGQGRTVRCTDQHAGEVGGEVLGTGNGLGDQFPRRHQIEVGIGNSVHGVLAALYVVERVRVVDVRREEGVDVEPRWCHEGKISRPGRRSQQVEKTSELAF